MEEAPIYSSDVAFTPSVKSVQARKGSRRGYARMEEGGSWQTTITTDLISFIAAQRSILPRHGKCGRAALYPASRRPARLSTNNR